MKQLIAGEDSSPILKRELLALDKNDRNKLLRDVGMTIDIPPEQGLAMKADLAIPWNKLRVIRRCIVTIHVHKHTLTYCGRKYII